MTSNEWGKLLIALGGTPLSVVEESWSVARKRPGTRVRWQDRHWWKVAGYRCVCFRLRSGCDSYLLSQIYRAFRAVTLAPLEGKEFNVSGSWCPSRRKIEKIIGCFLFIYHGSCGWIEVVLSYSKVVGAHEECSSHYKYQSTMEGAVVRLLVMFSSMAWIDWAPTLLGKETSQIKFRAEKIGWMMKACLDNPGYLRCSPGRVFTDEG